MSVTNRAGHPARTGRDDSHAQNSSGTTCDGCDERDADGVNVDGRSLCRPCARNAGTLVADGGVDVETVDDVDQDEDDGPECLPLIPSQASRIDKRSLKPAYVITVENTYCVDHVEELSEVVRLVNYDDDGDLSEVVSIPWHRIEAIEHYPAKAAIEESAYDGSDPLSAATGDADE